MTNEDVKGEVPENVQKAYDSIDYWTKRSTEWRRECVNLIASENVVSPAVRRALVSDFGCRYAEGRPGKRYYQGTWMFDEVEIIGQDLVKKLFGCDNADLSPLSGANGNLAALMALTEKGDTIMSLSLQHGAHITQTSVSAAGVLGLKSVYLPFDAEEMNIKAEEACERIIETKPKLVITAGSIYLFPHPVAELKEACDEIGARIMYDGAHVAGLIAGKAFPDPFEQGADVVTFSTHKTFPGPQGGMILYNDSLDEDLRKRLRESTFPRLVSNHHLHHVAGKAVAAAEMLEFGEAYAKQVVKNAQRLAASLDEMGMAVIGKKKGFTESHQVLVDVSDFGEGAEVAEKLERANIIVSKQVLPWEDDFENPSGVRLGTQEMTRVGMYEEDMDAIADFIRRVLADGHNPDELRREILKFKKNYNTVQYCFEPGEAYDYLENIK